VNGEPTSPLLELRDLHVTFGSRSRRKRPVHAVNGVSLDVQPGECLGLVGESGSGKSTVARAIMGLVPVAAGEILVDGVAVRARRGGVPGAQMVFQDPYSSLDPSMRVSESLAEPLWARRDLSRAQRAARVDELLELVGSAAEHATRYPHEFSGGQRQRLAIARALAGDPRLLVCDEAVSALDISTQNQVVNLLLRLQRDLGLALLFIAHDLSLVRTVSSRVAVMYLGQIVEAGPVAQIFDAPTHPYTEALLSAVPVPDPVGREERRRIVLRGDPPDPSNPPAGCAFHQRCRYALDRCSTEAPPTVPVPGGGVVSCHLHQEVGVAITQRAPKLTADEPTDAVPA
jgi:oligopeptide transport system ATP-binding protein